MGIRCPHCSADLGGDEDSCPACGETIEHRGSEEPPTHPFCLAAGGVLMFIVALAVILALAAILFISCTDAVWS